MLGVSMSNSHKRNHLYCKFVVVEYGTLGHHVHVCITDCMVDFIHGLFPEPNGGCTGHCDVDEEGNKVVDGNEDSCKGVLPQGNVLEVLTLNAK
jgi:hypothetical protein